MNRVCYMDLKEKAPRKPAAATGELGKAWDYLDLRGGVCRASEFDEDFKPIGPLLRMKLESLGVRSSTSGRTTIIFFPESK